VSAEVVVEVDGHIATITLNRPERLNTLTDTLVEQLVAAIEAAHHDDDVWVVVLRAEGTRAFCAGRDLAEVAEHDASDSAIADSLPMRGVRRNLFEAVVECAKPVVAAIFGYTLGGGAELALACDIRIAADDLAFGFPEVKRGFGANFASVMLPRMIPVGTANDLLFTGRTITAAEALDLHLVNRVVPADQLANTTTEYAAGLVANAPLTLRRCKAMGTKTQGMPIAAALRLDAAPNPYLSQDRKEGVAAFLEKRTPRWSAR
jgi:enoyl-CoA hydratase/carnithine racemase